MNEHFGKVIIFYTNQLFYAKLFGNLPFTHRQIKNGSNLSPTFDPQDFCLTLVPNFGFFHNVLIT